MNPVAIFAVYFLLLALFAVVGLLLLIAPRNYVRFMNWWNWPTRRLPEKADGHTSLVAPNRWIGLLMFLISVIMLALPLRDLFLHDADRVERPTHASPNSQVDWGLLLGASVVFVWAFYVAVKPWAVIALGEKLAPNRDFPRNIPSGARWTIRALAAVLMLFSLYFLVEVLRHA